MQITKKHVFTILIGLIFFVLFGVFGPKEAFLTSYNENAVGLAGFHAVHQIEPTDSSNKGTDSSDKSDNSNKGTDTPDASNKRTDSSNKGMFVWLFRNDSHKEIDKVRFYDKNIYSKLTCAYANSSDIIEKGEPSIKFFDDKESLKITDMVVYSKYPYMFGVERQALSSIDFANAVKQMEDNISDRNKETYPITYGKNAELFKELNIFTNTGLFNYCSIITVAVGVFAIMVVFFFRRYLPRLIHKIYPEIPLSWLQPLCMDMMTDKIVESKLEISEEIEAIPNLKLKQKRQIKEIINKKMQSLIKTLQQKG